MTIIKTNIQNHLRQVEKLILALPHDRSPEYTDEDLVYASFIFTHLMADVMYNKLKPKATREEIFGYMQDSGSDIRELLKKYTGLNMHTIVGSIGQKK